MKAIIKWLQENGLEYEEITLTNGITGLMVKTDYLGPYPSRESTKKQNLIMSKISKFKKLDTEPRGHYTAVLIKEIA